MAKVALDIPAPINHFKQILLKNILVILVTIFFSIAFSNCRSTRKINTTGINKDTTGIVPITSNADSATNAERTLKTLSDNRINYQTFSAKIKVDYTDAKGKQPDVNAFVRMQKDSLIWVSLNFSFLNVEALRVLMTTDSIFILNKVERTVELRPITYLEQVAKIPFNLSTLQDMLVGNPIFTGQKVLSYSQAGDKVLLMTLGDVFKNLLTISSSSNLIERSTLDDVNIASTRTADLWYSGYEIKDGRHFSTQRQITVTEKTQVDIKLDYKQYDFNTALSFPFNIPANYRSK